MVIGCLQLSQRVTGRWHVKLEISAVFELPHSATYLVLLSLNLIHNRRELYTDIEISCPNMRYR